MTKAHEGQEGSAANAVDADEATASTPGETDNPTPDKVVGADRGASDATVVVHKPGTRPPDISDIIGDETAEYSVDDAVDAATAEAVDEAAAAEDRAAASEATAVDLSALPPPAPPTAPPAASSRVDGPAPSGPPPAGPPTAEPVTPAPGLSPFDDRTVEIPAGAVDAMLAADVTSSPVPTGAPPPPPSPETIVDGPADPPPPPGGEESPSPEPVAEQPLPPRPPPPEPPSLDETPAVTPPPGPPSLDETPPAAPPVGAMGELDRGPVSIDSNPTTVVPAIDADQPPPAPPAFDDATTPDADPTTPDADPTGPEDAADKPDAADPSAGPKAEADSADADQATGPTAPAVAGGPPVGRAPEGIPAGEAPAPPPPPPPTADGPASLDTSATIEITPDAAAAAAGFGATVQIPPGGLPGGTPDTDGAPDPDATVRISPEDLPLNTTNTGATVDIPAADLPGVGADPPPPADPEATAIAGFTPVAPTDDAPESPSAADGATMVSPTAAPEIAATQAADAAALDAGATTLAPAAPAGPDVAPGPGPATEPLDTITDAATPATSIGGPPDLAGSAPGSPAEGGGETDGGAGRRRWPLVALGVVLGLIALIVVAWLIDSARTDGQVARGTTYGTTPIGGFDGAELETLADQLDLGLASTDVTLTVGEDEVQRDAAALGALIDRTHLDEAAFDARQGGFIGLQPFRWVGSFFTGEQIEPQYVVDLAAASGTVDDINANDLPQPLEPDLSFSGEQFDVVDGQPGVQIDPTEIVAALPDVLAGDGPFTIDVTPDDATPRFSNDEIAAVADEITAATEGTVNFQVLDQTAEVEGSALRSWVVVDTDGDEPDWRIDEVVALDELRPLFPTLGSEDQQARFSVVEGEPIIVPASETVVCCTPESLGLIRDQFDEPLPEPGEDADTDEDGNPILPARVITVEPEVVGSDEGVKELESLGIIEEVSTFTTEHACCQNRVTNIQRFADLMRGVIIRPGEELSLNDHVGRRTIENGFVADSAIANGILEPQVGGGVSQFATTFFNAAFYAGIDFNEYQSHSLYISRYPRGREATISFPRPDLSVTNTTDYGILVWTEYTPTSITVTFYSTKHIEVEDLPLIRSSNGQCSVFTTPRIRTYPDGEVVEDSVFALYRPGEGLDCNGNSTVPEEPEGPTVAPGDPPQVTDSEPTPEPDPVPEPDPILPPDPEPEPEPEA